MRIEAIRQVKATLNELVTNLPTDGSVIITKNGRPCAVLMPITEDTDLEVIALSQNRRFWRLYDRALERAEREGWTTLDDFERIRKETPAVLHDSLPRSRGRGGRTLRGRGRGRRRDEAR